MSVGRTAVLATLALALAQPSAAQRIAHSDWMEPPGDRLTAAVDVAAVRTSLNDAADQLVEHVLSIDLAIEPQRTVLAPRLQEAAGGGTSSTLGTISGSLGPIANSLSMITRKDDPAESNGLSDGLAITGAGLAVLGGVLQVVAMTRSSDAGQQDQNASAAAASDRTLRDQQRLGAGVLEDIERLLAEEGAGLFADDVEPWGRRADRALARADYVVRETRRELEGLVSRLGSEVALGDRAGVYAPWRRAQRALSDFPAID